jgi:hypothetical protein
MKLELVQWRENEDGSANFHLDVDEEGKELLFRVALKTMLENAIKYAKEYEVVDESGTGVVNSEWGGAGSKDGSGEQPSKSGQQADGFKTSQVLG